MGVRHAKAACERGLTMAQLTSKAGVSRATVAHYLTLGLLQPPRKTARNMAYYDPESVERIALIRELQDKRNLSLGAIKELLDDRGSTGLRRIVAEIQRVERFMEGWLSKPEQATSRDSLLRVSALDPAVLDELETTGLVVRTADGQYDGVSADLAMAVARMRDFGLRDDLELPTADLLRYRDAVEQFVQEEIRYFNSRVVGRVSREQGFALVRSVMEATEAFWVAIRRRVLLDFLDRVGEPDGVSSAAAGGDVDRSEDPV